jgi:lipopolysaccharide transport system ATP-binding protein
MDKPIIEIKNIGKKYNITHQRGGYVALRDVLMNVMKSPFSFLKTKAKQVSGFEKKEEFWALKDVNFTVKKGEVIGIIGNNGAGKSTLLKILSKITPPTEGEIVLRGRVGSLLEVGTGFHPELTGRENIFLNGAILGMKGKEIAKKFDEIVDFSGIGKFLDTPVKYYSSGMYVRLAFSVAAHMDPDILIIDEVLAVGDAEFQKKCLGKMDEITKKEGRTILFVSHNMAAINQLCNKIILLDKGKIMNSGNDVEGVIKKYLSDQSNGSSIGIWESKDNRYDTEYLKPLKLQITDIDGNPENMPLSGNKGAFVSIQLEIKKTDPILNVAYALYDDKHNIVYWSASTDKKQRSWLKIEKGKIRMLAEIPLQILNDGSYRLEFMSSLHNRMWIHKPGNGPAINFTIKKISNDSERIIMSRPGIIVPELEWKVEK